MSRAPWHAEHTLEAEAMARIVERRFPEFVLPTVVALQPGWDYFAFQVDEDWVFKVPKRASVVSRMRQEVSLLTALPTMPASIPRPTFHGVAAADLPVPFFGYPRLEGRFATEVAAADVVLPQLLAFFDVLHHIEPPFAVDEPREAPWPRQAAALEPLLELYPDLRPGWTWMRDHPPGAAPRKALLHADLGPEHVLLDAVEPKLVAIIDWADAIRGDPARELVALLLWEPEATVAAHANHDGSAAELERAIAYALRKGLTMLRDFDRWGSNTKAAHKDILVRLQNVV